ncbi:MAG: hypothetical protein JW779_02280 [Candidatus Thorarchaeota archaeon]|nr:hypothetical protein [Candidatus Thorarchaeota archaeon]
MSKEGRELFKGFIEGIFSVTGSSDFGTHIHYIIPFDIKIQLEKTRKSFTGKYSLVAHPVITQPHAGMMQNPGILSLFPAEKVNILWPPMDPNYIMLSQSLCAPEIKADGAVKVTDFGNNRIRLQLLDVPQKFIVSATALSRRIIQQGSSISETFLTGLGVHDFDFGYFSKDSPNYLNEIVFNFSQKLLGFEVHFKDAASTKFPRNGQTQFTGIGFLEKTESFYSVVSEKGTKYVEQVPEVEEARQLFLEHPELLARIQTEARRTIRHGVDDDKVSQSLVDSVLRSKDRAQKVSLSEGTEQKSGSGIEHRNLDEIFLEALKVLVKYGGSSNHAMVVSCGWAKFMRIEKGKKLQVDVAGSMYLQSSCKLNESHIETLKEMGLLLDSHSVEIYTTKFDATSEEELIKAAKLIEPIFSKVYRRKKGEEAYLEMILGIKTPEAVAALDKLAIQFPRRDGFKLKFRW